MPVSDKYNVIFFHIPKTAGSSIEKLLEIEYNPGNPRGNLLQTKNTEENPAYQHFLPKSVFQVLEQDHREYIWDHSFKFTIIRNPYTRAISTYHFLKHNKLYKSFCCHPDTFCTFSNFLRFCAETIEYINMCGDDSKYDKIPHLHHLRPQQHWFRKENNVYDKVLSFENLGDDIRGLFKQLDYEMPIHMPCENISKKKKHSLEFYYSDKNTLNYFERAYGHDRILPGKYYPRLVINQSKIRKWWNKIRIFSIHTKNKYTSSWKK